MIYAISFDLDDTLWDTAPVIQRAEEVTHDWLATHFPRIAERYSVTGLMALRAEVSRQEPERAFDFTYMRRKTFHLAAVQAGYMPEEVVDAAFDLFLQERHRVAFFDDVLPTLDWLHKQFRLVALTNGNADIGRIGLQHYFEFALCARDIGRPKPHPDLFTAACARLNATPEQVVHVGDHLEHDIAGAAAAGLRTIWLNRERSPLTIDQQPDAEIHSLSELRRILENWQ